MDTLQTLLMFHVSYGAVRYIHEDTVMNWREFEERLHFGYPVRGIGIKATRANLKIIDAEDGGFLHRNEDLYPGEIPSQFQTFPYQAASAAYAFTLLEGYGDDLVEIVNPGHLKLRQSWHHGVYRDLNLKDKAQLAKARDGYVEPFKCKPTSITRYTVERLLDIKSVRNKFMHEGHSNVDFEAFFTQVVATVLALHFMLLPSEKSISLYPYYDYHGKWK